MRSKCCVLTFLLIFIGVSHAFADVRMEVHRASKMAESEIKSSNITESEVESLKINSQRNVNSLNRLGDYYFLKGQFEDSFSCYFDASKKGSIEGAYRAGLLVLRGRIKNVSVGEGGGLIHKAAKQGHPIAKYLVGSIYKEGYGTSINNHESNRWYEAAKESGVNEDTLIFEQKYVAAMEKWHESVGTVGAAGGSQVAVQPLAVDDLTNWRGQPQDVVLYQRGSRLPSAEGISLETLQDIWTRMSKSTGFSAHVVYDDTDVINASMGLYDGGFVCTVNKGMLDILRTEDEMAGIVGHEIGHGVLDHIRKMMGQKAGLSIFADMVGRITGIGPVGSVFLGAGVVLAEKGYSREQEVEADDFGVEASAKAGYSSWGSYDAALRFSSAGLITLPSGFLTHPPTERRLENLKNQARKWEQ